MSPHQNSNIISHKNCKQSIKLHMETHSQPGQNNTEEEESTGGITTPDYNYNGKNNMGLS